MFSSSKSKGNFFLCFGRSNALWDTSNVSDIDGVSWSFSQDSVIVLKNEDIEDLTLKIVNFINNKYSINNDTLLKSRNFILDNYATSLWADKIIDYYKSII